MTTAATDLLPLVAPRGTPETASRPTSTTLIVENMHCGGCIAKVERTLKALPGVANARANLSTKRVTVELRPTATAAPDSLPLLDALTGAGFRATEMAAAAKSDADAIDKDYLKRLAVAGFAAANIMLLSVSVWSGANGDMSGSLQSLFHWLSALIALPAIAYAGQPFFRSAAAALRVRRVNMDVPISLGVTLATAMSVYQTIVGSEQVYFDAAVTLLFFLLIGRALDARMRSRAASAAENLLGLRAQSALVIGADGIPTRTAAKLLAPGMRILTAAGERFAVDGRIVDGASEIDESLITGETKPRAVTVGDTIYAGTVNLGQPVTAVAMATDESSLVADIARLMAAAEQGRASYVRLADRAARLYAPAVHTLALATFAGWLAFGYGWETALGAAIAVLIITCPCALALAVPAVQVAATSRLFGRGVLVKAPDALERLAEVDTVVLDKTGTLTLGEPSLTNGAAIDDATLARAASLAGASRHPYARAVVRAARARGLSIDIAADTKETPGSGLARPHADGEERLGSARWCGVAQSDGHPLWYRAGNAAPVAFAFEDKLRPDAAQFIAALHKAGFAVEILSGDRHAEVARIAAEAGIGRFKGELLPADKLARLAALAQNGRKTLMIGDGLNDAPALAAAHASLSPATAADISQTAADAMFQGERLQPALETLAVSREVHRMSLQNFAIAIGYNVIFVPLAVVGLVTPLIAAVAMSASSIAVVANALRLKTKSLRLGAERIAP